MKKAIADRIAANREKKHGLAKIAKGKQSARIQEHIANLTGDKSLRAADKELLSSRSASPVDAIAGGPGRKFPLRAKAKAIQNSNKLALALPSDGLSDLDTLELTEAELRDAEISIGLKARNEAKLNTSSPLPPYAQQIVDRGFKWTRQSETACRLCAEGLPPVIVAKRQRISPPVLERWLNNTEFQFRIRHYHEIMTEQVLTNGLANRIHRLRQMNENYNSQLQIIEERAQREQAKPAEERVPGGATGWLNNNLEYDAVLARSQADLMKSAAIEMGQWQENAAPITKIEVSYADKQLIINQDRTPPVTAKYEASTA